MFGQGMQHRRQGMSCLKAASGLFGWSAKCPMVALQLPQVVPVQMLAHSVGHGELPSLPWENWPLWRRC